jgi:hypothetical protein
MVGRAMSLQGPTTANQPHFEVVGVVGDVCLKLESRRLGGTSARRITKGERNTSHRLRGTPELVPGVTKLKLRDSWDLPTETPIEVALKIYKQRKEKRMPIYMRLSICAQLILGDIG